MTLMNKHNIPIWDGDIAGIIITSIMQKYDCDRYLTHHRQCGCALCSVIASYCDIIDVDNPEEIVFKNVDNIVTYCLLEQFGRYTDPHYTTLDGTLRVKDVQKIWNQIPQSKNGENDFIDCTTVRRENSGFSSRYLILRFRIVHTGCKRLVVEKPAIDHSKLVHPNRPNNVFKLNDDDFKYDDVIDTVPESQKGDFIRLIEEGIPKYFLMYLLKLGKILHF